MKVEQRTVHIRKEISILDNCTINQALADLEFAEIWRFTAFAPVIWGDRTMDFVPSLETMGEYKFRG